MSLSNQSYLNWRYALTLCILVVVTGLSQSVYSRYGDLKPPNTLRYRQRIHRLPSTETHRSYSVPRRNPVSRVNRQYSATTSRYGSGRFPTKSVVHTAKPVRVRKVLTERNGVLAYKVVSDRTSYSPNTSEKSRLMKVDGNTRLTSHSYVRTPKSYRVGETAYRPNQIPFLDKYVHRLPTRNSVQPESPISSVANMPRYVKPSVVRVPTPDYPLIDVKSNLKQDLTPSPDFKLFRPSSDLIDGDTHLDNLIPPPGLRFVVVEESSKPKGKGRVSGGHSRFKSIRKGSRLFKTSRRDSPDRSSSPKILRIKTASIDEARALVDGLGLGFKISLVNATTNDVIINKVRTNDLPSTKHLSVTTTSATTLQPVTEYPLLEGKAREQGIHWWKGNHVCVEDSPGLFGLTSSILTRVKTVETCREKGRRFVCTQRYGFGKHSPTKTTTYECCDGFMVNLDRSACEPGPFYRPNSVGSAGSSWLDRSVNTDPLGIRPTSDGERLTIFMPSDDDVISAFMSHNDTELGEKNRVQLFLENHVIPNRKLLSSQMKNNQIFKAISGNQLRVNFFPTDLDNIMTVNCRRVTITDVLSDNSVVHFIDGVIEEVRQTTAEYIAERLDTFSTLFTVLTNSDVLRELKLSNKSYTMFAPTNAAFRAFPVNTECTKCVNALARNHVVDKIVCTAGVEQESYVTSMYGENMTIVEIGDKKFIQRAEIKVRDVMTANGVIHVVDRVLKPSSLLSMLDVLEINPDFSSMLKMFQTADIAKALATGTNFTLVIPTNRAFKKTSKSATRQLLSDPDNLRNLLMYHVIPELVTSQDLKTSDKFETLNPPMDIHVSNYKARVPTRRRRYRKWRAVTALQCAKVIGQPKIQPCNGVIFIVDKVLNPPKGSLFSALMYSKQSNFSTLLIAIRRAGLEQIIDGYADFTFFAPSDVAFSRLPFHVMQLLLNSKKRLMRLIKFHLVPGFRCYHELLQRSYRHKTLLGSRLMSSPKRKIVYLGRKRRKLRAKVMESDLSASNGIIHSIDNLLLPRRFYLYPKPNSFKP